ncbi:MAG: YqgE/AlgH family protein [Kofleriaceae bacterium]|nr:YqgE/AlgH family protein [Kofleriaceae bacterium]
MFDTDLAPGLLLAMPQLQDPHFSRAVVLMVEHNDEGSMGLIINQPSEVTAVELLEHLQMPWRGSPTELVFAGGPVRPNTGWVLHQPMVEIEPRPQRGSNTIEVSPGISLTNSPDRLRTIAGAPPRWFRLLLGYAGWGPGQLAEEMAEGAWLHAAVSPELVFATPADRIWDAAVRSLGISPDTVVVSRGVN